MNNFFEVEQVHSNLLFGRVTQKIPLISFVIPTFKRYDSLKEAILSILNQEPVDYIIYNIIVVSNDNEFNIDLLDVELDPDKVLIYANNQNVGMCNNMNKCAMLANGSFISYLQDDDVLLPNYLHEIGKLFVANRLDDIDCLIPNRSYYFDGKSIQTTFGKKAKLKGRLKGFLFNTFQKKREALQKITANDCANDWYNGFGGGPTCGIMFKKSSFMDFGGFNSNYPYIFDLVFFVDFSERYNTVLYNKTLSVYRTTDSASNRSEVQADFFRGDMYLLNRTIDSSRFVKKYREEITFFCYKSKPVGAQKIIYRDRVIPQCSKVRYIIFRVKHNLKLLRSNLCRFEISEINLK